MRGSVLHQISIIKHNFTWFKIKLKKQSNPGEIYEVFRQGKTPQKLIDPLRLMRQLAN